MRMRSQRPLDRAFIANGKPTILTLIQLQNNLTQRIQVVENENTPARTREADTRREP